MFINVVITRAILFCAGVPPSPPSAPSLVSRNATSFVSLLRKVPRPSSAPLSLSLLACVREKGRKKRERERGRRFVPLTLRFFHPFFLSLPFSLSPIERIPLVFAQLSPTLPLFRSYLFSTVLSLIFLLSPGAEALLPSGSPSRCFSAWSFSFPSSYSPAGGFPPEFTPRVSLPLAATAPHYTAVPASLFPFPSSFFVPVDRGVPRSSNLNASRTDVSYRLRK